MADNTDLLRLKETNYKEFLRVMQEARSKMIVPHPSQKLVLDSPARYRVMNCGRRWGKTKLSSYIFASKARKPNQMLWWVAPTYKVTKRGYAMVLERLPDGVLAKPAPPESNFDAGRAVILHFKNGTKMEFYSAERPEGMLGAAVDFCVMDEAAIMPGRIWNQIVAPTLMDNAGGALMISTPRGKNWFYKCWLDGQDPEKKLWESWTFTSLDNPYLPEGAAEEMASQLPRMEAQQEVYAKWLAEGQNVFMIDPASVDDGVVSESTGMVWEPDEYGNPLVPRKVSGAVFMGVDLGRTNDYTVLYGTLENTRKNVYFDRFSNIAWEEQRRRIKRAVRQLMRAGAEYVMLVIDEGNGGTIIKEDMEEAGYSVEGVNFTSHKQNMVRLLATDLEVQHAFILRDMYSEFENYGMTTTARGVLQYSAPEGEHDDVVSSKMLSHWGCVNFGAGNVQLMEADPNAPTFDDMVDPWDEEEDASDLIDEDVVADLDVGLAPQQTAEDLLYAKPPTAHELMNRDDLWF